MIRKTFVINGVTRNILVDENETLATFLRERLLLTGCKIGCGEGHCGACNVIVNGKVTRSCLTKLGKIKDGAEITTIEGIGTLSDLHPLQVAWMAHGCAQCGFCSPGFIMTAKVLLDNNNAPTREEVRDRFQKNRNLCRCTGYKPLVDAVMDAARVIRGEITKEDLIFKPTGDSIVGTKYIRPSAAQKVTGTWDFGADDALKMPEGTLRLALVQAKVSHALIKGIDTSEAEKMPGVEKIITAMDWFPLYNSIRIAAISTVIIFFVGIFAAYYIAKTPRIVKGVLDVILTLPLVLPPTVVGEIENPFSYTVMARATPSAAPVGWETNKEIWRTIRSEEIELCMPPEALLLLKDETKEVMK